MAVPELETGLYEVLLTTALERQISNLDNSILAPEMRALANAEAADRLARHLASVVTRPIAALPDEHRVEGGTRLVEQLIEQLATRSSTVVLETDLPLDPGRILAAILNRRPDGTPDALETPLTPLLDTTLLTNSPGEKRSAALRNLEHGSNVVLFARLSVSDRAFWCLGPATYVSHEGERPIAITWRLQHRLPGDLFAQFAAAVA
jgi:hypothetical protein